MSDVLCSTFVLAVCDLDTSVRFYVNKLDFVEDFRVDGRNVSMTLRQLRNEFSVAG